MARFKVGDKVKIVRAAKTGENGWPGKWISQMKAAGTRLGKIVNEERTKSAPQKVKRIIKPLETKTVVI